MQEETQEIDVAAAVSVYAATKEKEKGARPFIKACALIATDGKIKDAYKRIADEKDAAQAQFAEVIAEATAAEQAAADEAKKVAQAARETVRVAAEARAPEACAKMRKVSAFFAQETINAERRALGLAPRTMSVRVAVKDVSQVV